MRRGAPVSGRHEQSDFVYEDAPEVSGSMNIAYVMPTRNRAEVLDRTLRALGGLPRHAAEVIVVDNNSDARPQVPRELENGVGVRLLTLHENLGAAARNVGVEASDPGSRWIVMLDDDSHPTSIGFVDALIRAPEDVLAVSADIHLPGQGCREQGGLPEVFIGCGVAIRREAFLRAAGYDRAFNYYVEEYDLAARFLLMGGRVAFERLFHVEHDKVATGRDMNLILERLIRNNGWVAQRYAPDAYRRAELRHLRARYRAIAEKERAIAGYARGLLELRRTRASQPRREMTRETYDRFTGLAHARAAISCALRERGFRTAAITARGKNAWAVGQALREHGVVLTDERSTDVLVIGTMSPGPMIDAAVRIGLENADRRVVVPWVCSGAGSGVGSGVVDASTRAA